MFKVRMNRISIFPHPLKKAIAWLVTLIQRSFVGTESRLLTLFELLKQMIEGSESDPQMRVAELHKRRDEIDREIEQILSGDIAMLDNTAMASAPFTANPQRALQICSI